MPSPFTVSMYNIGTSSLSPNHPKDPSMKIEHFDNKIEALEFAASKKDTYSKVIVKNHKGQLLKKYDNGKLV